MRLALIALTALTIAAPMRALAQDVIPDVEYFAGKDGMPEKKKGTLVLSAESVTFTDRDGGKVFVIPLGEITQVERQTDVRDASVGKKLLFGGLAGSRKQEFVTISTETESAAEAVVFKVKQNTAAAVVAKINFYRKKAGHAVEGDSSAARKANQGAPE